MLMSNAKTISTDEARKNFSELVSRAYFSGKQTAITRNNQPMAWIVGEPFMQGLREFIELLEHENPSLADTLAIMLSDNLRREIEQSADEAERGEVVSFESILDAE